MENKEDTLIPPGSVEDVSVTVMGPDQSTNDQDTAPVTSTSPNVTVTTPSTMAAPIMSSGAGTELHRYDSN